MDAVLKTYAGNISVPRELTGFHSPLTSSKNPRLNFFHLCTTVGISACRRSCNPPKSQKSQT